MLYTLKKQTKQTKTSLLIRSSSNTNEFLRECQGTALLEADPNRGRSRLNDRERRQAALPILVFGNDMVSILLSSYIYIAYKC